LIKGHFLNPGNRLGIRAIALFDGGKAMLMLGGLLTFILVFHSNAYGLAQSLVSNLHVNPQGHYVSLLLMFAAKFKGAKLLIACACAFLYSAIKISEAFGLWYKRQWGRTLGIASIGVLIPYEIYELFHQYTHFKLLVLAINAGIVLYLMLFFNKPSHPGQ
jgi:uncharacterized membrane protein (DUF2068 family)